MAQETKPQESTEEKPKTETAVEVSETTPTIRPKKSTEVGMVEIAETPEAIAAKFEKFEKLRGLILKDSDFYEIKNKDKTKVVGYGVGKTGLYKLGVAFNLDTVIIEERKYTKPDEPTYVGYKITMQCTAPNGRICTDGGFADNLQTDLGGEVSEHICRSMAITRSRERCYTVMTGETGKKSDKTSKPTIPTPTKFCQCAEPRTMPDGKCKECGEYSKLWWDNHGKTLL